MVLLVALSFLDAGTVYVVIPLQLGAALLFATWKVRGVRLDWEIARIEEVLARRAGELDEDLYIAAGLGTYRLRSGSGAILRFEPELWLLVFFVASSVRIFLFD
ncbi:hypothetical protein OG558_12355 [Kribbella sp. NBC_01510]|uniref:hypothetical protein n=1 Tax=Kribbella sp. NBC_01510 TaxID=2903581 RepID=UPI00386D19DF